MSTGDVLGLAVPSATGVGGLLAPAPSAHALLPVAHSWTHEPLGRLTELLDVAAVLGRDGRSRAGELACKWGWEGIWREVPAVTDLYSRSVAAELQVVEYEHATAGLHQ